MEFMLKMQVPDGKPKAGMVHHKIHDKEWTALGIAPRPGRAAALPVAAVDGGDAEPGGDGGAVRAHLGEAGQGVRGDRCLAAAEKAWAAAVANPAVLRGHVGGRRRAVRRQGRQRRVLLGRGGAVRRRPRRTSTRRRSRSRRTSRRCRRSTATTRHPDVDDLGHGRRRSGRSRWRRCRTGCPPKDIDDCKAAIKAAADSFVGARRQPGLPRAVQARQEGLPVGLELVRAQQRDRHGAGRTTSPATRSTSTPSPRG